MRLSAALLVAAPTLFGVACTPPHNKPAAQPVTLTVTEANRTVVGYVSLIEGKQIDPDVNLAWKKGCRIDDAWMPAGPPWYVNRKESIYNPTPEQISDALKNLKTLAAQGFKPTPWTRPEPEPPNHESYKDDRGYIAVVHAEDYAGQPVLEIEATSPCAND